MKVQSPCPQGGTEAATLETTRADVSQGPCKSCGVSHPGLEADWGKAGYPIPAWPCHSQRGEPPDSCLDCGPSIGPFHRPWEGKQSGLGGDPHLLAGPKDPLASQGHPHL